MAQEEVPPRIPDSSGFKPDSAWVPDSAFMRRPEAKKDTTHPVDFYNIDDTLQERFLVERFNLKNDMARSFFHDAGDFLRFNPSNFIVEYQEVPLRKTVSPFNLPGDRMNVILDDRRLSPFEHLPEPDNMTNFDDIPTFQVQNAYNIEGPLGMAFGGDNSSSSLILLPHDPEGTRAESRMVAESGWNGYAYTKGLFTHESESGRSLKAGAGYRNSEGAFLDTDDDAYHQWAEVIYPLTPKVQLDLSGRLYKREGGYRHRATISAYDFERFRRDRDLSAGLRYGHNADMTSGIQFRHQRSESKLERHPGIYFRTIDMFDNAVTLTHERRLGGADLGVSLEAGEERYEDGNLTDTRKFGSVEAKYHRGRGAISYLLLLKGETASGFDPLPSAMLAVTKNGEKSYFSASVGYSSKFPRQYELYMVERAGGILTDLGDDYLEHGNPDLDPEKQLIGNLTYALGRAGNDLRLSVTGGLIKDGIDWERRDNPIYTEGEYSPVNRDIDFATATLQKKLSLGSLLYCSGGASYHYVKIDDDDDPPYSPDFQAFGNLGLYYHIKKVDVHLYAYGEAIYNDKYNGYNGQEYGQDIILNMKFTFRIKKFQFYYIFQNFPATDYYSREDYLYVDRFNYYGVTWEFWD